MNMGAIGKVLLLEALISSVSGFSDPRSHQEKIESVYPASNEREVRPSLRGQAVIPPASFLQTNSTESHFEDGVRTDLAFLEGIPTSNPSQNKALEDQVTDLFKLSSMRASMTKEQFDATPFGNSVKKILDLITHTMMPKVMEAHTANQNELFKLSDDVHRCASTKNVQAHEADKKGKLYQKYSPLHGTCRAGEAGSYTVKTTCWEEEADKKKIMDLKCQAFEMVKKQIGDQTANKQIMKKGGSESTESYVTRLSATVCGQCKGKGCKLLGKSEDADGKAKKCGYDPYTCGCGMQCKFDKARDACHKAQSDYHHQLQKCKEETKDWKAKRAECDSLQDQMDDSSCKGAVEMKDACEAYSECHFVQSKAYMSSEKMVKAEEQDRHAEWKGLMRMKCLIKAFSGGKVSSQEIDGCKSATHKTDHLIIKYPKLPGLGKCTVPELYPSTPAYKAVNFAPLPALAKGKQDAYDCAGLKEVNTVPATGSPKTCRCKRLTMNGPYTAGPMVKCVNCLDVRRSLEKNSCPDGTKLFAPRTESDWKTFLASAGPLHAPNFIVDITRPQNGCGGCKAPMNSHDPAQRSWKTQDKTPWWLDGMRHVNQPSANYQANCFLDLKYHMGEAGVTKSFKSDACNYHAKSYYCQPEQRSMKPKSGSPNGCVCKEVALNGRYSAGTLLKCVGCLRVSKSMEKNSCPIGTKIFSPASREDWKTILASATPLRSPHWIIDVTQPQNGCGGCTRNAMNSRNPAQATWRTTDHSPWFLRSTKFSEPNGDYKANCYLNLDTPSNENSVTFNDHGCKVNSNSYYCQPAKIKKKPLPPPPEPEEMPPVRTGPPVPEPGGKYKNYACHPSGVYTGLNKDCGHFKNVSISDCRAKCAASSSALGKKSCDKITGVPNCIGFVYKKDEQMCMLYRACTKLVKWNGSQTELKPNYNPVAKTFQMHKDMRCSKVQPYTQPGGKKLGMTNVTQQHCWKTCFNNQFFGDEAVPIKRCVAMAFYPKDGYCDLYDKCDKTAPHKGSVTYIKLQPFENATTASQEKDDDDDDDGS